MHYFTIRYYKEKLKEIRNYLQYDTNATKKDTSTTMQLITD